MMVSRMQGEIKEKRKTRELQERTEQGTLL